jgi:ligand-binding sensor domain-containing protein
MIKCKGILIFFFCVLTSHAFSQDYNFRNFNSEEGLAQPYIYSIIQDEHGYLWVGTGDGLYRYNGFIFKPFTTSDSLADNFITSAINDGEGLWFGHMNGRLSYFNGKKFHTVNIPQSNLISG